MISARTVTANAQLDAIVDAIAAGFQATRIILFGSRARGDAGPDSDYDIAVEHDTGLDYYDARREVNEALSSVAGTTNGIDVLIRVPGQIERNLNDVGRMDYDIAREGVVVWPPELRGTRLRVPSVVRETPPTPPESVRDWLERADVDLLVIDNELRSDVVPWSAICFHAQQAAEKYLKVLLILRHVRPARTHDLVDILAAARTAGYALPDLDGHCNELNEYAVDTRYPDDLPMPGEASGRRAVDAVRAIVEAARAAGARAGTE